MNLLTWTVPFTFLGAAAGALYGACTAGLRERTRLVAQGSQYAETLFNSVGENILTIDAVYRIRKANRAFLAQSGYGSEDEVKGRSCWEVLHRGTGPCEDVEYCPVREVFASGSEGTGVHTHFTKDGRELEVEIAAYPVRGIDGTVSEAVTVMRDLTARRHAEEELKAYTRQIEHSNHLKSLFSDILSHDLLNPAMVTAHMADSLAEREHPRDIKEVEVIQRNARKLLTLLHDASKYARMESLDSLKKERRDVMPLLGEVMDRHRASFEGRNMNLLLEGEGPSFALINPLFEEVLQNILGNALKYAPPDSTVTVRVAPAERGIDISVADQGEGIPDEFKRSIFERFERSGDAGVKGSGLGLAIARRIVDLHDGTIWVEDAPGGGSVFHVFLPDEEPR